MVHTMTITHSILSKKIYDEIFENLNKLSKSKEGRFYPKGNEYITHAMKDKGFSRIALMKKKINSKYKYPYMQISITLNPAILIGKNIEDIIEAFEIEDVQREFDKEITPIHKDLPRLNNWIVNRIDYAVNIETKYVSEYIKLFQRSDKPYNFKEPYSLKSKRRKQMKGSFYLTSNSVNINFYDKGNERKKAGVEGIDNLLRLEVQCKKNKVNSIKNSKKFDSCMVEHFLDPSLSQETIDYYFRKVIGNGHYLTLSEAIRTIKNSSYKRKTKDKCIDVLKQINRQRSIWKAREKSKYDRGEFNRYLKLIIGLKVNPVTIPKAWEVEYLDTIMSIFQIYF